MLVSASTVRAYDQMAPEYAARFAAADLRHHRLRFESGLGRNARILDARCGSGRDCRLFEIDGLRPVGVDLSTGLLAEAKRVVRSPLVRADIKALPFRNSSFLGIWCCAVLLHFSESEALEAIKEWARVLIPGASIFLSARVGSGEERDRDGRWFRFYSETEVMDLLNGAGFGEIAVVVERGVATTHLWLNVHARLLG